MGDEPQQMKLRAPAEDGRALLEPRWDHVAEVLAQNRRSHSEISLHLAGSSIQSLCRAVRRELFQEAVAYTTHYRDVDLAGVDPDDSPLIMTGHQPELFHPGVWFKNFVLNQLAREHKAVPVHVIVDNDVGSSAAIRVPGGTADRPVTQTLEFDRPSALPFEERPLQDVSLYSSLGERVVGTIQSLVPDPLIAQEWAPAIQADVEEQCLGWRIARFRHRFEAKLGLQTLEIPLSRVCDHEAFRCLVAELLTRHQEIHDAYNDELTRHRQENRIRSEAHPVPNLRSEEQWLELPLWIWTEDRPLREPLFVRRMSGVTQLRAGNDTSYWTLDMSTEQVQDGLLALRDQGIKIRPRALLTTLYARLFLSDLFLHGIGGAKYDELTDQLIRRWFQVNPPQFLVATATLQLPIKHDHVLPSRISELKQELRRLYYHPEGFLEPVVLEDDRVSTWLRQKQRWIGQEAERGARKARHDGIAEANDHLRKLVRPKHDAAEAQLAEVRQRVRHQAILESREYAFCLFPHNFIGATLFDCLPSSA